MDERDLKAWKTTMSRDILFADSPVLLTKWHGRDERGRVVSPLKKNLTRRRANRLIRTADAELIKQEHISKRLSKILDGYLWMDDGEIRASDGIRTPTAHSSYRCSSRECRDWSWGRETPSIHVEVAAPWDPNSGLVTGSVMLASGTGVAGSMMPGREGLGILSVAAATSVTLVARNFDRLIQPRRKVLNIFGAGPAFLGGDMEERTFLGEDLEAHNLLRSLGQQDLRELVTAMLLWDRLDREALLEGAPVAELRQMQTELVTVWRAKVAAGIAEEQEWLERRRKMIGRGAAPVGAHAAVGRTSDDDGAHNIDPEEEKQLTDTLYVEGPAGPIR